MDVDGDKWAERFVIGLVSLIGLIVLLAVLGTAVGRALLAFAIVVVTAIFALGWAGDIVLEAVEEYK